MRVREFDESDWTQLWAIIREVVRRQAIAFIGCGADRLDPATGSGAR